MKLRKKMCDVWF